jgi:hypothetical protein
LIVAQEEAAARLAMEQHELEASKLDHHKLTNEFSSSSVITAATQVTATAASSRLEHP